MKENTEQPVCNSSITLLNKDSGYSTRFGLLEKISKTRSADCVFHHCDVMLFAKYQSHLPTILQWHSVV